MRISGGAARGIPLRAPKGVDLRPAMDRLRQGVFSSLGARVVGARFVDLFAGTGSYGLEALSRGAAGGVFVERHRATVAALRENLAAVCRSAGRSDEGVRIAAADTLTWTPAAHEAADLVFIDPPFAEIPTVGARVLERCAAMLRDPASGIVVFEMPGEVEVSSPGWRCTNRIGQGRGQPTCCFYVRT
ncbi:16S rRNA (guanine(966)-N(2))-methyltransferase RsmD [Opitutales bacterium ASA1]|uniref:RsmD family RNA methyltransferase n=1 Tax=Congregicoccus parvus TaxID=3081749 RepID=UPI002B31CA9C|nr:16S rRNA (guanine(966)-N(2))-methyltransferase RsmD [Opitutales bacterium ASA1]